MEWYWLIVGAGLLAVVAGIIDLFIIKGFKIGQGHDGERLSKVKAYAAKANWDKNWPAASDVYILICSLPKRVRQSNASVHNIIAKHFKMEHMEAMRMMRVYRKEILEKILEDRRQK